MQAAELIRSVVEKLGVSEHAVKGRFASEFREMVRVSPTALDYWLRRYG